MYLVHSIHETKATSIIPYHELSLSYNEICFCCGCFDTLTLDSPIALQVIEGQHEVLYNSLFLYAAVVFHDGGCLDDDTVIQQDQSLRFPGAPEDISGDKSPQPIIPMEERTANSLPTVGSGVGCSCIASARLVC